MINFFVSGEPMAKERPRFNRKTGGAYTPEKTRGYETLIIEEFMASPDKGKYYENTPLAVLITAYFLPPIKSKLDYPVSKDLDNIVKIVLDALNKVAFDDDKHIVKIVAEKGFSDREGIEIMINEYKGGWR